MRRFLPGSPPSASAVQPVKWGLDEPSLRAHPPRGSRPGCLTDVAPAQLAVPGGSSRRGSQLSSEHLSLDLAKNLPPVPSTKWISGRLPGLPPPQADLTHRPAAATPMEHRAVATVPLCLPPASVPWKEVSPLAWARPCGGAGVPAGASRGQHGHKPRPAQQEPPVCQTLLPTSTHTLVVVGFFFFERRAGLDP